MTGRDLIYYILENHLEDTELFIDGHIPGLLSVSEAATKFHVGVSTVNAWCEIGIIKCLKINGIMYIPENVKPNIKGNNVDA